MSPEDVVDHIRHGEQAVFLDSRSASAYEQATGSIPGSLRVPPTEVDLHVAELPRSAPLVVSYCT
jgi:rhodanese-related sulfurtransferase